MQHSCEKEKEINTLQINTNNIMNHLKDIKEDLKNNQQKNRECFASKFQMQENEKRIQRIERVIDKILLTAIFSAI